MPIIPEKKQLEDHVQGAVASQFWSQSIQNSRSLTGQTCTAPCEPQPLRLSAPSGLSRAQFLVATRAARVPVIPGYCDEHEGTVVDRVLFQHGGQSWWGAVIGRAKLQRAVKQHNNTRLRDNLSDPDNYALAATGRLQLSKTTTLRATMQVDSLQQLQPIMPQGPLWRWQRQQQQQEPQQQQPARSSSQLWQRPGWPGVSSKSSSASLQLKQQLEGLELTADLGVNECSVEGVRRYCKTPLRIAVDLAPSSSSSSRKKGKAGWLSGVLFRVGLHGVVAPVETQAASAAAAAAGDLQQQQQHALSVHCQGAIAMHGSHTLWEAKQKPWEIAAEEAKQQQRHERQQQQWRQQQQEQQEEQQRLAMEVEQLSLESPNSNNSNSSSSSGGGNAGNEASTGDSAAATAGSSAPSLSSSSSSSEAKPQRRSSSRVSSRQATARSANGSSSSIGGSKKKSLRFMGDDIPLPLCNPVGVQESLQEASSAIERLRTDIRSWQSRVSAGELSQLGVAKKSPGLLDKQPGACWSSFIAAPHVKVAGLFGLLSRVPLQQQTLLATGSSGSSSSTGHPQRSSSHTSLASSEVAAAADDTAAAAAAGSNTRSQPSGRPLTRRAKSFLAASATHLDKLVLGSAKNLSNSIMQESILRPFASGAASMQFGEMRGNFFDYTRIEAAIDLGLNAPEASAVAPAAARTPAVAARDSIKRQRSNRRGVRPASPKRGMETILGPAAAADLAAAAPSDLPPIAATGSSKAHLSPAPLSPQQQQQPASSSTGAQSISKHKHPAFALDERSVWHALTLSATQQLVGPVRLRGECRFALDSTHACPRGAGWVQPSAPLGLFKHVTGVSPALVESAVGVDVVVPGAGGLLRVVGWWSGGRKEGGLELRLM